MTTDRAENDPAETARASAPKVASENEPYAIRCGRGHDLGTLTGPILVTVHCEQCGGYVQALRAEQVRTLADGGEIGRCADNYGDEIVFTVLDGGVCVQFFRADGEDYVGMWFDADERDRFIKLWAEAERQAEAQDT